MGGRRAGLGETTRIKNYRKRSKFYLSIGDDPWYTFLALCSFGRSFHYLITLFSFSLVQLVGCQRVASSAAESKGSDALTTTISIPPIFGLS
jgi:hypothetical protein